MALYLIGDIQGCNQALGHLLDHLNFSPSRDELVLLGDLVNRGPDSLGVLRRLVALDGSARCLLGNHDLHLLAVAAGVRGPGRHDTLDALLQTPEREALLHWLRQQHLALLQPTASRPCLMVHAGVLPSWSVDQTMALAGELQSVLRSPDHLDFLRHMYGNTPDAWSETLSGWERLRVIVNALTRLRYCSAEGQMEFDSKEGLDAAPEGFMPWFDVPGRQSAEALIAFGHWSTLGPLQRPDVQALDSGCVWGGSLTALRLDSSAAAQHARISVPCPQAQVPGQA
jgi:bis(5'-nucleosyl)-tetraphosphatase (symmetrical)